MAFFLQFVEDDAKNKLSSGNLTYLAANLKSAFYNSFFSTFITDLPAGQVQFATLNFEPYTSRSGLLDLDHLCLRGQVWQSKSYPINLPSDASLKKNTKNTRTLKPSPQFLEEAGPNHLNQTMGDEIRSDRKDYLHEQQTSITCTEAGGG